jgi:hypothetical protein
MVATTLGFNKCQKYTINRENWTNKTYDTSHHASITVGRERERERAKERRLQLGIEIVVLTTRCATQSKALTERKLNAVEHESRKAQPEVTVRQTHVARVPTRRHASIEITRDDKCKTGKRDTSKLINHHPLTMGEYEGMQKGCKSKEEMKCELTCT